MTAHSGGCQCGAVRYRAEGGIRNAHLCHCRMCQKAAGNYFMPLGNAAWENFWITRGEPSWFQSSDKVRRGFCEKCGTPLFFDGNSDHINIVLGSLDDPASVMPRMQCGTDAKMPWFGELDGIAHQPDSEEEQAWLREVAQAVHQHPDHDTETWPEEETQ